MKKRTVLIATLVVLVTLLVSVMPVGAHGGLTLLSAKNTPGGAVIAFKVHKDFGKFTGTAYFGGEAFPLSCKLKENDPDVLLCRGSKELGGKYVQVVVNGLSFETFVLAAPAYCNPVYDVPYLGLDPEWWYYGDYCTEQPPSFGDLADLTGFYPWGTWTYKFKPTGSCPGINDFGLGWYWDVDCGGPS